MKLITTSVDISTKEWERLMKYTRPCSGRVLRNKIKRELPYLYNSLSLDFYNPYEEQCRHSSKTGIYVYVHSGNEYFLK